MSHRTSPKEPRQSLPRQIPIKQQTPIKPQVPIKPRHPNLPSVDETRERWRRFVTQPTPALRDMLILQYTPLVKYVLGRVSAGATAVMDHDDMLSAGTVGLIEAVGRFDPALGVKFETYAIRRIRGAMFDALRRADRLSRSVRTHQRKLERTTEALREKLGREPEAHEVAQALGLSLDRYHTIVSDSAWVTVSLDKLLHPDNENDNYLESELPDPRAADVAASAERNDSVRRLGTAIQALPDRDQILLSLYYKEELTQKEIAALLEISESRVCQLHRRTLKSLRVALTEPPSQAQEPTPIDSLAAAA
jgi:RNA polymerase sigma factor for flagellar operon FliA